ncbi:NUDIX domain-containing protein [Candidatus Saccharibacteria bacterium]|nr:NUDIX domain-containing protein [Candidatus Saccharibacteria bacterium]
MIKKLSQEEIRKHKGVSFAGVSTCFFCTDGNGKLFMAKRSQQSRDERGNWDVGAGGLKFGQSAEHNAIREIQEEYGVTPKSIKFIGYRDAFRTLPDGTPTHWVALDFLAVVDPSEIMINEPEMFDDCGWYELDKLPTPLHSQLPAAIKKYHKEFR